MYYELYIDVLFFINFIMNLLVLIMENKFLRYSASKFRLAAASALGAVWVCIVSVIHIFPPVVEKVITYLCISAVMVIVGFGLRKWKEIVKGILVLYGICLLYTSRCV